MNGEFFNSSYIYPANGNELYLRIPQLSNPLVERIRSNVHGIEKSTRYAKVYKTVIFLFPNTVSVLNFLRQYFCDLVVRLVAVYSYQNHYSCSYSAVDLCKILRSFP